MSGLAAAGGLIAGCYFVRSPGLTVIRTAREVAHTLYGERAGRLVVITHPDHRREAMVAPDDATLARWACRLAAEYGGAIKLEVTHG